MVTRQLVAIRDLAETTLGMLGAGADLDGAGDCPHPPKQRVGAGVMGSPDRFFCKACQTFVQTCAVAAAAEG